MLESFNCLGDSFLFSTESVRYISESYISHPAWINLPEFHHNVLNSNFSALNLLKPNDIYIRRTAALTSRRYILNIYSTNIHTEYFKHVT